MDCLENFCYRKFYLAFDYIYSNVVSGGFLIVFCLVGFFFLVGVFFGNEDKSPGTAEEPCLVSMKSHLHLIENTSFENDDCHSVACGVNHTAHGKLPDQLNVNITAKSKPVQ